MKKFVFTIVMSASMLTMPAFASNQPSPTILSAEWMKSKTQTWPGIYEGKTYWYKIDDMAKLWWSMDGNKWASVDSGYWTDKDGKWLKIHEGKLVWSTDGKTWSDVPEWKWEASDGKWYKFDSSWKLWVN